MSASPLLGVPGAVAAEGIDAGLAAHYGNPLIEQRHLEAGTALVDLSTQGVLTVTGPDRLSWLNSLASQKLDRLDAGGSAETLFLDPQGRIEHDVRLLDDGVSTWMLVEAAELAPLQAWLDRMRFMLRVELADRTQDYATLGILNTDAAALGITPAAPNGVELVWRDPWAAGAVGGWQYAEPVDHPSAEWNWSLVLVDRAELPALADRVGSGSLQAAGTLALEALRIAAWRPRRAAEVDEKSIPHELDWLRTAVHLDKGCYRGQETVAKVHNLGHPPRRLVMLHLDGSDTVLPARGDEVLAERTRPESEAGWQACGEITSSAIHHELGPIALAVIRRGVPVQAPLRVRTAETGEVIAAAQQVIVPPKAGAAAGIPRMPRLGIRR
ncbi:folate-binding protein [Rathayibacter sp. YIM 133350]|uniref:CAF17-like 4Fe-4S cluster assembly/insertion protein YgfZ n=1 Tax=Rathayibacter sp. YIM 133350 TaxID=3131992 RepID=UPI00307F5614